MRIKKCFICLTTILLIALSDCGVNVFATVVNNTQEASIVPYAEETQWYFRIVDGRLQKRLWSNTYAKWLTEWEWA